MSHTAVILLSLSIALLSGLFSVLIFSSLEVVSIVVSLLLDLFMQLVTNNNLNVLFSTKNIEKILNLRNYFINIFMKIVLILLK